jgi:hypothetical protein
MRVTHFGPVRHSDRRKACRSIALVGAVLTLAVTGAWRQVPAAQAEQPYLYCNGTYGLDGGCPPPTYWTGFPADPLYNEGRNENGGWGAVQDYGTVSGYTGVYEGCCRNTVYDNLGGEQEKFPKVWNASNESALIHGRYGV